MIEFLKSIFSPNPEKKLIKERDRLYEKSVTLQRNGDLRGYGAVMTRIKEIEDELSQLIEEK
jgi:hypothetical protein